MTPLPEFTILRFDPPTAVYVLVKRGVEAEDAVAALREVIGARGIPQRGEYLVVVETARIAIEVTLRDLDHPDSVLA